MILPIMKKLLLVSLLSCFLSITTSKAYNGIWQPINANNVPTKGEQIIVPDKYKVYSTNTPYFKNLLINVSVNPENAIIIELPTPDGNYKTFRVWQDPIMEEGLAQKYPDFKTFTAVSTDNKFITAKLDFTLYGFHAMIYDGSNTFFIEPYSNVEDGYYRTFYKKDYTRSLNHSMVCEVGQEQNIAESEQINLTKDGLPNIQFKQNGTTKKTYRLALACTAQYAIAVAGPNPTKPAVLSKMITSVNRVSGVYERELTVHLNLINNTDTLIFLVPGTSTSGYDATTNPYHDQQGSTMLGENQNVVTARIGTANFDIGHVFSTGGGGIAMLGCVCSQTQKARGVTGSSNPVGDSYDIDYVAHEMGHQFGGNHTFNANTGSCSGNGNQNTAYEPGSGTTIMAYAGICGTANDMQPHSNPYFHAISLSEISTYITTGGGNNCPSTIPSGNNIPTIIAFYKNYWIPEKTPFELVAPTAVDTDHDTLTYCWEQWNLGDYKKDISAVRKYGPIVRSFNPTTSPSRMFPQVSKMVQGVINYLDEKLPDTNRYLRFKLTVRDIYNGLGTFNFPDDTIHLDVDSNGAFTVTSQPINDTLMGSSMQLITWNVAKTNLSPVSCDSVEIWFSIDGGYTFPFYRGTYANDGSEMVKIPNPMTATNLARVKVKGRNNVFFNINSANFRIEFNTGINDVDWTNEVLVYPIPANEDLIIENKLDQNLQASIINPIGQIIWIGTLNNKTSIHVKDWAKGIFYLQLTNKFGERVVKSIIVQ